MRTGRSAGRPAGSSTASSTERVSPWAGRSTVQADRIAPCRLPQRDVHGEVGPALAVLVRAVERVDDPDALGVEPGGVVLALLAEDGVVAAGPRVSSSMMQHVRRRGRPACAGRWRRPCRRSGRTTTAARAAAARPRAPRRGRARHRIGAASVRFSRTGDPIRSGSRPFTGQRRSGVVPVLRALEALGDERLDGVGRPLDDLGQLLALGRPQRLEHEVRRVLPPGRPADPDADAEEVAGAERLRMLFSPLWPLSPPPSLTRIAANGMSSSSCTTTRRSGRPCRSDISALTGPPDSFMYDERLGEDQVRIDPGIPSLPSAACAWPRLCRQPAPTCAGEHVDDEEADVVPGGRVLRARVAEPDDEPRAADTDYSAGVSLRARASAACRRLDVGLVGRGVGVLLGLVLGVGTACFAASAASSPLATAASRAWTTEAAPCRPPRRRRWRP